MNTREKVLKEALNCVNGEREKQYGNPEDNFRRIADLWSVYLTSLFEDEKIVVEIDPIDVAKMMILFKIARSNGDKDKLDNYVDIIGYGACAAEIFESETEESKVAESRSCSKKASDNIMDFFERVAPGTVINKEEFKKCMCENNCDGNRIKGNPPKNKYNSWQAYTNIATHIALKSSRANIDPFDVVDRLIRKGNAPTDMAALLQDGKLNFDDIASYVEDTINELKQEDAK